MACSLTQFYPGAGVAACDMPVFKEMNVELSNKAFNTRATIRFDTRWPYIIGYTG